MESVYVGVYVFTITCVVILLYVLIVIMSTTGL